MLFHNVLSLLLLSSLATVESKSSSPDCTNLTVSVKVDAAYCPVLIPVLENGYQAIAFLLAATGRDANTSSLLGPPVNISKTFSISAQYCAPSSHSKNSSVVQVLTHGLGFDKTYWSFGNATYNYVEAATGAGYATLSYDRLGTGLSDKPDPYTIIQSSIELVVLTTLTELLKSGNICPSIPVPAKIVHVGHSYGSVLTNALVASRPDLSDGIVLTGFSHNSTYQRWFEISTGFALARENQPTRFQGWSSGYITWGDKYYNQYSFLTYPFLDPAVLEYTEAHKWPFTIGEALTTGSLPLLSPKFTKPVLMMAASSDLIFCGGDCHGVVDGPYSLSPLVFSNAKPFKTYIQPNTGHGMNLHYNATGWYRVMNDFLGANYL